VAKKIFLAVKKADSQLNRGMKWLCLLLLAGMTVMGTFDVLGRYLVDRPIKGTYETFGFLLPALVLLGMAFTQEAREHVRIDLAINQMPFRAKTAVGILTDVIALGITALIFRGGLLTMFHYKEMGKLVDTILIPLWPTWIVIPIGAFAMMIVLILQITEGAMALAGQPDKKSAPAAAAERS
jgi:TRAP-type C4-dicarboxylate transport system permease small subunit